MAISNTPVSAIDCVVKLDDALGNLVDISGSSNSVEISFEDGVAEWRPFGTRWKRRIMVGKDGSFSLDFAYTTTDNEAKDLLTEWQLTDAPVARTIEVYIPDDSPGSDLYTAEVVLSDLQFSADASADEIIMGSATLLPDLAVTKTQAV